MACPERCDLTALLPPHAHLDNAFIPGTGRFTADQAVADIDYNATKKDTLSIKYFYQHDPTIAPYRYSSVPGFDEHLDSGAQVASITNTFVVKSNLSTTQTLGYIREKELGRQRTGLRTQLPFLAGLPAPDPSTCSVRIISRASRSITSWAAISPLASAPSI